MKFLPITINITNKNILIIGGGRVAYHKVKLILPFTDRISIIAKEVCPEIQALNLPFQVKEYEPDDLNGFFLVYACTNIKLLNSKVHEDAHKKGILVNVVDNPPMCDFVSPAIYKIDHMTVAVGSNAQDVYHSIRLRDKIKDYLENDSTY